MRNLLFEFLGQFCLKKEKISFNLIELNFLNLNLRKWKKTKTRNLLRINEDDLPWGEEKNCLYIIKYIYHLKNFHIWFDESRISRRAGKYGCLKIARYMILKDKKRAENIIDEEFYYAARFSKLNIIKFLAPKIQLVYSDGSGLANYSFRWAIENNRRDIIKYFVEDLKIPLKFTYYDNKIYYYSLLAAVKNNMDDIFNILYDSYPPYRFDKKKLRKREIFHEAVKGGNLEIVKTIVSKEKSIIYDGNGWAFRWAVRKGHLELVKYFYSLYERNFLTTFVRKCSLDWAIKYDHKDIEKYLKEILD